MEFGGQWSNDNILQMLELYKQEPCLWDPRTREYKNRSAHFGAWQRIVRRLPFKTTVDEAKKKKNSLMGYYRIHLNRYKKTLALTGGRSVYKTTWFAFELMHSFLRPIYGPKKKKKMIPNSVVDSGELVEIKSEPRSGSEASDHPDEISIDFKDEYPIEINDDSPVIKSILYPEVDVNEVETLPQPRIEVNEQLVNNMEKEEPYTRGNHHHRHPNLSFQVASKPVTFESEVRLDHEPGFGKSGNSTRETTLNNSECDCLKKEATSRDKQNSMDEYDHFGFMMASKIRKIRGTPEREILMNSIQNLVFETYMKCRKSNSQDT